MNKRSLALYTCVLAASCSADDSTDSWSEPPEMIDSAECLQKDRGGTNGDSDSCRGTITCTSGEGDCDSDAECSAPLVCGRDNGGLFGMPANFDVCVAA